MEPRISQFTANKLAETQSFLRVALRNDDYVMDFDTRDADLRDIEAHYQAAGGEFWLLLSGREEAVIGCIGLERVNEDTLELKRFVVHEPVRGHGYGEKLLLTALNFAADAACNRIRATANDSQQAALSLLRKHRFHAIKRFSSDAKAQYFFEHRIQEKSSARASPQV